MTGQDKTGRDVTGRDETGRDETGRDETGLRAHLVARIRAEGPITVATYMAACLMHPDHGYYTTRQPFGPDGDFVTAPDISQIFGELLGLVLAQGWLDQGAPARFTLGELGPGRGTLMADALRATRGVPGFHAAMDIVLVESSPRLRAVQAATLAPFAPRWIDAAQDLPDQPLFLVANEFFDALPVHQFLRHPTGWQERLVTETDGALQFCLSPPVPHDLFDPRFGADPDGTLVEICPSATQVMRSLGLRIAQHGGLALIVDYGGWRSKGDTLQAVRRHGFADPLADPGMADLTAHVDFEALALATPLMHLFAPQGQVLTALGVQERARVLARQLGGAALERHLDAVRRLTAADEMGELFRMLALFPPTAPKPAGFA